MALLDDVKVALRVSASAFDDEIVDLIEASQEDLVLAGVLQSIMDAFIANPDSDKTIKRAVTTYAKAYFGWNNPDAEYFKDAYDMQKTRITLVDAYIKEVV